MMISSRTSLSFTVPPKASGPIGPFHLYLTKCIGRNFLCAADHPANDAVSAHSRHPLAPISQVGSTRGGGYGYQARDMSGRSRQRGRRRVRCLATASCDELAADVEAAGAHLRLLAQPVRLYLVRA